MIDPGMIDKELMEYFRELSPRDRRVMLDDLEEQDNLNQDVLQFCRKLYNERYTDPKDPEHRVDNWLWKIVYLPGLYSKRKMLKSPLRKEAGEAISDLHLDDTGRFSDMEKTLLYLEFRNAAKRYLSTCSSDGYGSKMFGLKKLSAEEKKQRASEDIWTASRGIAVAAGEEERFEIWCIALRDELFQYDRACEGYYEELERRTD